MKEKFPCEFIRDLLPGYIDGITSEESNQIIEEHLKECESCANMLEQMREMIPPSQTDSSIMVKERRIDYGKKIKKKRWILNGMIALFTTMIVLIGVIFWLRDYNAFTSAGGDWDYINTGTMITWKDFEQSGFSYKGERYIKMNFLFEEKAVSRDLIEEKLEHPAFNIKYKVDFIKTLINRDGRSVMYEVKTPLNLPMYYSDDINSGVELYCREKDQQKFKDYYDQVDYYYTGIYDDGRELTKIACSKKEIEALWNIEKQKKQDLTVENQEKSYIFICGSESHVIGIL